MTVEDAQNYELSTRRITVAGLIGPLLETAQKIPHIHEVMPEPFDMTNHAGNMFGGFSIALGVTLGYAMRNGNNEEALTIPEESMSRFRRRGAAIIMGATALANCVTETKWGLQHFSVGEWLHGTTPDILDTVYSTVWGGVLSLAFWKRAK
jgi:hypothetical protein